jgi:hypothetical protein
LLVGFVTGQLKMLEGERLTDVMTSETADCPISMIRVGLKQRQSEGALFRCGVAWICTDEPCMSHICGVVVSLYASSDAAFLVYCDVCVQFSPDGRYFATADVNHHVGLWAVKVGPHSFSPKVLCARSIVLFASTTIIYTYIHTYQTNLYTADVNHHVGLWAVKVGPHSFSPTHTHSGLATGICCLL